MADMKFDDFDGGYSSPENGRVSRLINLAGAACSVALVLGMAVWGYQLAVRDVNGIPVFRALAGPLRVAPDNPGGDVMAHQGLSVNAIASAGAAMPLPESLTLAPKSAELTAEDVAGLVVATEAAAMMDEGGDQNAAAAAAAAPPAGSSDLAVSDIAVSDIAATDILATEILTPQEVAADAPLPLTQAEAVDLALAAALADGAEPFADEAVAETTPVLVASVRPRLRPRTEVTSADAAGINDVAVSDVQQVAAVAPLEIDPTTIAAGTRLVQLGAFDDEPAARAEWTKLQGQFAELINGKAIVVQSAQSGGRTFYRLRAHGFAGEDEARRFCAALLAENASCIPVAQR